MSKIKTLCCNVAPVRKGRADYRCPLCGKDVTLELYFINESKSQKESNKKRQGNAKKNL